MERLRGCKWQQGIFKPLTTWREAVTDVQERRRDEVVNAITHRNSSLQSHNYTSEQGK